MLKRDLTTVIFNPTYATGSEHEPQEMIKLGLTQSILYRRASGYFSSSVLQLFKRETLDFAKSGGKINIMCSPVMSAEDHKQISQGYEQREILKDGIIKEVSNLSDTNAHEEKLSFLSTLIHLSILEVKIIFFKNGTGIFHDKSGYFQDSNDNALSFVGSANESHSAFSGGGNFERLTSFISWEARDFERCHDTRSYVDKLWNGEIEGLGVFDFPDVAKEVLQRYAKDNLQELDQVFYPKTKDSNKIKALFPHQKLALENWQKAGRRGILKHATGSGKTITAIGAVRNHMKTGNPTLVLVPSKLLLEQWYKELKAELGEVLIMRCGAGHTTWKKNQNLKQILQSSTDGQNGTIVIAINDTASSDDFMNQLSNLKNTLVIADEAHTLGSAKNSNIMNKDFAFRLGLSATPERYRDPEGTENLFNFFDGIIKPEVSLQDALKMGRLVPYDYYPILTYLNAQEEDDWAKITQRIINYIRINKVESKSIKDHRQLSTLLINRSRIAKKARSKIEVVTETVINNYNDGEYWLVYCEDSDQLYEINERLSNHAFHTFIYTSDMDGSPKDELEAFTTQSGILLSIRCLDEGVDIPKISHAVIAASSQNPRQFIQRRGRVLRKYPDKLNAVIYDCIVMPADSNSRTSYDGLIVSEAVRSLQFAKTARNANSADSTLRNILITIGSDPDEVLSELDSDTENE